MSASKRNTTRVLFCNDFIVACRQRRKRDRGQTRLRDTSLGRVLAARRNTLSQVSLHG